MRAMDGPARREDPLGAGPEPVEVSISVSGVPWNVRAEGHTRAAHGAGGVPLLLVRYSRPDGEEPGRQAWIVGRCLSEVPEARLAEGLREAKPWVDPPSDRPFFDSASGRRGR